MKPGEHKTVQSRILAYAEAIGWTFVPREEAEERRGGHSCSFVTVLRRPAQRQGIVAPSDDVIVFSDVVSYRCPSQQQLGEILECTQGGKISLL